jgi:uncharacterized protein with LGFP repeats
MRSAMRLLAVLAALATCLVAPVATSAPTQQAAAADLRLFDPGNIISDAVFFDGLAMNAGEIQAFLDAKGSACRIGADGSPCLKNYSMNTVSRAGDSLCAGYQGAANESAATIIAKVAVSCRVSPRVLLVLLEKEMGFIRTTNPTAKKYDRAAGYACPDNVGGWCNPEYAGLQNQLYRSGWQYQRYAANASSYSYRAGRNNVIQWHPNGGCGTSTVYIQNQATAGLYNYTPYRPNQRALDAGYGTGDGCSSYGNRNFWNFFTDWFGSTQSTGGGEILAKYQAMGGAGSPLGAVVGTFYCGLRDGGCFQPFQNGSIYWSRATGPQAVLGRLLISYGERAWETGSLGYPTSDGFCGLPGGGCFQPFQGGTLYWSPAAGTAITRGAVHDAWGANGWEAGWLGYPVGDATCGLSGGGCGQGFERGVIYWSPATAAYPMTAEMLARWDALGRETGGLGYPATDRVCGLRDGGCVQHFQNGSLYWSPATGTRWVRGAIRDSWAGGGWEGGWLGYPTTDEICGLRDGGCGQGFQYGSLYWSLTTGAHPSNREVESGWTRHGREAGVLGYPAADVVCGIRDGGCVQHYQRGTVYWSPATGSQVVRGAIRDTWAASGWEGSWLGYPLADELCGLAGGGCFQPFQYGSIYWSPTTGARPVPLEIRNGWASAGWETGRWGYPTGEPLASGTLLTQRFQGGTARWDHATGQLTFD